jgi:tetratricopeptide (TPR) repeat protein
VSEEAERVGSGPEGNGAGIDPTAVALALAGASREKADAFLDDQRALISDQRQHLHEQSKQIHLDIWEKRLGVLLRGATLAIGFFVLGAFGLLVWNAANSTGLLIQSFSVPPDLAKDGLTGDAVAAKLLDRLAAMQALTSTTRAAKSYTNNWGQDIRLDIPETGVSLAELDGFLHSKLGHDTHISGEIERTATGLDLTVRAGPDGAATVSGTVADTGGLIQRAAEAVYRITQPYRFGIYLGYMSRTAESSSIFESLSKTGPIAERGWGYSGHAIVMADTEGLDQSLALLRKAVSIAPENILVRRGLAESEIQKSLPEAAVRDAQAAMQGLAGTGRSMIRAEIIPGAQALLQAEIFLEQGDFHAATSQAAVVVAAEPPGGRVSLSALLAMAQLGEHDTSAARTTMREPIRIDSVSPGIPAFHEIWARVLLQEAMENWTGELSEENNVEALFEKHPGIRSIPPTTVTPLFAIAEARLGRVEEAEARIARTPGDCNICLRARARIAALRGQNLRADFWFARAVADAPSVPFAFHEWGNALLSRGQPDAAIAQFKLANQKGPHFADPIEGWGEALMAKNQSHLALAKFTEAEKYAPNWGRLHLKWGEALAYAGRRDEAKKQFARAAQLDLTGAEKAELAVASRV